jgi:hypothetical protein
MYIIYTLCATPWVQVHKCKSPSSGARKWAKQCSEQAQKVPSESRFVCEAVHHSSIIIYSCVCLGLWSTSPSTSICQFLGLESCSFKKAKCNAWQSVWTLELVQVPWPSPTKSRKFCWGLLTGSFSTSRIECFGTVRNWRPSRIERLLDRPHSTADPGELLQASLVWSIDQSDFWEIGSPPGPHSVRWRPYRVSLIWKRAYILHTRSWANHMEVTSLNGRRANGHRSAQRPNENLEHKLLRS